MVGTSTVCNHDIPAVCRIHDNYVHNKFDPQMSAIYDNLFNGKIHNVSKNHNKNKINLIR